MQPSHTRDGVDLGGRRIIKKKTEARAICDIAEVGAIRELLHTGRGPILVQARIESGDTPRVLPNRDGHAIKQRFVAALNVPAR
jgi:phosphonopyruvate decarboxylase